MAACLGDVSGKGVGAAMLMSAAQTQLRATLRHESDPARAVELLNREVVSRLLTDGFISLWTGSIDVDPSLVLPAATVISVYRDAPIQPTDDEANVETPLTARRRYISTVHRAGAHPTRG